MRRWLDVLQRNLQSMSCPGNVYGYNIDGKQVDVDGYSGEAVCVEPDDFCSYGLRKGGNDNVSG
mgnify:CR=1 FL=1